MEVYIKQFTPAWERLEDFSAEVGFRLIGKHVAIRQWSNNIRKKSARALRLEHSKEHT